MKSISSPTTLSNSNNTGQYLQGEVANGATMKSVQALNNLRKDVLTLATSLKELKSKQDIDICIGAETELRTLILKQISLENEVLIPALVRHGFRDDAEIAYLDHHILIESLQDYDTPLAYIVDTLIEHLQIELSCTALQPEIAAH